MSKSEPYVMVTRAVLDSPAWRHMSLGGRVLYFSLRRRYWSDRKNNGRIYLSQRDAAKEVGRGTTQITRWFRELQHYGFIVQTQRGSLGSNGVGRAPHWRLTEVGYMKEEATRNFLLWDGTPFRETPPPRERADKSLAFCTGCGVEFKRRRKDNRFCSHSCRQKVYRERDGTRDGKQFPVQEKGDAHVPEKGDRGVHEKGDSVTDMRGRKRGHTRQIGVHETGDISSIPSSRAHRLPWSTPALTEIPMSECLATVPVKRLRVVN